MVITREAFQEFISAISQEFDVYIPVKSKNGEHFNLSLYNAESEWLIAGCRPTDPLKTLFYPPRDRILPLKTANSKKRLIFGVKNCDLKALTILDHALLDDPNFTDLNYQNLRESTYIIGADCTEVLPTCHCNLMEIEPYPQNNYDLNMSEVRAGYHLEERSAKGAELIALMKKYISVNDTGNDGIQAELNLNRKRITDLLITQNQAFVSYKLDCENKNNSPWPNFSKTCVECGGCCYICPTCYCILIRDVTEKPKEFHKMKTWDSCQHTGYAKVAGGGTPRPNLWQRFRHRYLCKFSVMVQNFSEAGCTGCGRCIATCPAGIDIRETVVNSGQ